MVLTPKRRSRGRPRQLDEAVDPFAELTGYTYFSQTRGPPRLISSYPPHIVVPKTITVTERDEVASEVSIEDALEQQIDQAYPPLSKHHNTNLSPWGITNNSNLPFHNPTWGMTTIPIEDDHHWPSDEDRTPQKKPRQWEFCNGVHDLEPARQDNEIIRTNQNDDIVSWASYEEFHIHHHRAAQDADL